MLSVVDSKDRAEAFRFPFFDDLDCLGELKASRVNSLDEVMG